MRKVVLAAAKSNPSASLRNFNIAVAAFKALHSNDDEQSPNSNTYEYFLRACSRQLPAGDSQTTWTHRAFTLCRERGLVTPLLIKQVCCVLPGIVEELEKAPRFATMGDRKLSDGPHNLYVIPGSWCRAVSDKDRSKKVEVGDPHAISSRF
jgi:hypothetical protein